MSHTSPGTSDAPHGLRRVVTLTVVTIVVAAGTTAIVWLGHQGALVVALQESSFEQLGRFCLLIVAVAYFLQRVLDRRAATILRVTEPLVVFTALNGYWNREIGAGQAVAILVFGIATLSFLVRLGEHLDQGQPLGIHSQPRLSGTLNAAWTLSPPLSLFIVALGFGAFLLLGMWLPQPSTDRTPPSPRAVESSDRGSSARNEGSPTTSRPAKSPAKEEPPGAASEAPAEPMDGSR